MQLLKTFRPLHGFLKRHKTALALIAAFLLFRFLIISTSLDLFDYEECIRGTVALELMHGLRAPYIDYMWTAYDGAGLSLPAVIVPFFLIFGVSGFTLKLMMLLTFSLGAFILIYLISLRYFGARTALFVALLALLSPPLFTIRGLISQHEFEDTFFTLLIMFLFFRIFYGGKTRVRDFIFFGLVVGFALWFGGMTAGITITCLIFWFALDRRFFLRGKFAIFLASFIVGLSPAIYYNLATGMPLLYQIKSRFLAGSAETFAALPAKTINYLAAELPASLNFRGFSFIGGEVFNYIYYIAFATSAVIVAVSFLRRNEHGCGRNGPGGGKNEPYGRFKRIAQLFPLAFLVVYSAGYLLGRFSAAPELGGKGFRYFVPMLPFMFIIIAQAFVLLAGGGERNSRSAGHAKKTGKKTRAAFAVLGLLLCIGFLSNAMLISPRNLNFGNGSIYKPYCHGWLAEKFGFMHHASASAAEKFCEGFEGESSAQCYWGVGQGIGYYEVFAKRCKNGEECGSTEHLWNAVRKCGELQQEHRESCYSGIVWDIANAYPQDIGTINALCGELGKACENCCAESIGMFIYPSLENCSMLDARYKKACYRQFGGISESCGAVPLEFYGECVNGTAYETVFTWKIKPAALAQYCNAFPPQYSGDCCHGIMRALDELYYEFPEKKAAIIRSAGEGFAALCPEAKALAPQD